MIGVFNGITYLPEHRVISGIFIALSVFYALILQNGMNANIDKFDAKYHAGIVRSKWAAYA